MLHYNNSRKDRGDPVLHIDLRKWADIAIIAPLDANTLAKVGEHFVCLLSIYSCYVKCYPKTPVSIIPLEVIIILFINIPINTNRRCLYEPLCPSVSDLNKYKTFLFLFGTYFMLTFFT